MGRPMSGPKERGNAEKLENNGKTDSWETYFLFQQLLDYFHSI